MYVFSRSDNSTNHLGNKNKVIKVELTVKWFSQFPDSWASGKVEFVAKSRRAPKKQSNKNKSAY
jgi:hypothetical protein